MSEKAKITREQAEILNLLPKESAAERESLIESRIKRTFCNDWYCLNDLTIDEFIKALYIGYEVEEEYMKGDWVLFSYFGDEYIAKILEINENGVFITDITLHANDQNNFSLSRIERHATEEEIAQEKERRFWNSLGRDVWELKIGDILSRSHEDFAESITVKEIKDDINHIVFFEETFSKHIHTVRNKFKLACPVEQRLDQ